MLTGPVDGRLDHDHDDDHHRPSDVLLARVSAADSMWTPPPPNGHRRIVPGSASTVVPAPELGSLNPAPSEIDGCEPALAGSDDYPSLRRETVLVVDDNTLHRESLTAVFAAHDIAKPRTAWDLPSLVAALQEIAPTLVLLNMETRSSHSLLRVMVKLRPEARVIVLGLSEEDESEIVACAETGVVAYHMRTDSIDDLLALMRKVAVSGVSCSSRVSAILLRRLSALAAQQPQEPHSLDLTARETQILVMLEMGLSNREIAARLCIAVHTVKNHVHNVLRKLGVGSRAEAGARYRAMRHAEEHRRN